MKKITAALLSTAFFFAACTNNGSSTVGSYEREETHETEKTEGNKSHSEAVHAEGNADSKKAHISADNNGVDVETKSFKSDTTTKH